LSLSRHCYYHGRVVGDPLGWAALSTCHGIDGVIHAHGESIAITPNMLAGEEEQQQQAKHHGQTTQSRRAMRAQSARRHMYSLSASPAEQEEKLTHEHLVYRVSDYTPVSTVCGVGAEQEAKMHSVGHAHAEMQSQSQQSQQQRQQAEQSQHQHSSESMTPEAIVRRLSGARVPFSLNGTEYAGKKYVELLVINDSERMKLLGDNTEHDSLALVNLVDSYYRTTPTKYRYRIVLVGQVSFTNGDPYRIPFVGGGGGGGGRPNYQPTTPSYQPNTPSYQPTPYNPTPYTPYQPYNPGYNPYNPGYNPYARRSEQAPAAPAPAAPAAPAASPLSQAEPDFSTVPAELQHLVPQMQENLKNSQGGGGEAQAQPILAAPAAGLVETQGTSGLLEIFNQWHSSDKALPRRDNTQLFSGLPFSSGVLGLANVGMSCYPQYSGSVTSLNEPSALQNAIIAAHETGHTLGMTHDGMGNECPTSGYIMASVAGVGNTFSTCSIRYLDQWSDEQTTPGPNTCVDDFPYQWLSEDTEPAPADADANVTQAIQRVFNAIIQSGHSAAEVTGSSSAGTSSMSRNVMLLIASACFLSGATAMLGLMQLYRRLKKRASSSSSSSAQSSSSASSSPTAAKTAKTSPPPHKESAALALNVAPSAPSTPLHAEGGGHKRSSSSSYNSSTSSAASTPTAGASSSLSSSVAAMHLTRAKRRPSLGSTHSSDTTNLLHVPDTIPSESPEVDM
jgi:hypothetical protein